MDMTSASVGATLATAAITGGYAWVQANSTTSALDRLAEVTPLVAILLSGMWILFAAYRGLVDRLVTVVEANTRATTESTAVMREIQTELRHQDDRLDRLESGRAHLGGPPS